MIDWLIVRYRVDWLIDWLCGIESIDWLIDREVFGRLIDWLTTDFVAFWQVIWLIVYLLDWEFSCDFQCPRVFRISFWTQKVTHLTDHSSPVNECDAWLAGPGVLWRGSVWSASDNGYRSRAGHRGGYASTNPHKQHTDASTDRFKSGPRLAGHDFRPSRADLLLFHTTGMCCTVQCTSSKHMRILISSHSDLWLNSRALLFNNGVRHFRFFGRMAPVIMIQELFRHDWPLLFRFCCRALSKGRVFSLDQLGGLDFLRVLKEDFSVQDGPTRRSVHLERSSVERGVEGEGPVRGVEGEGPVRDYWAATGLNGVWNAKFST